MKDLNWDQFETPEWKAIFEGIWADLLKLKGPPEALTVLSLLLMKIYHCSSLCDDHSFEEFLAIYSGIVLKHHSKHKHKSESSLQ